MIDSSNIETQRWFMGKNRKVLSVDTVDSLTLGKVSFSIVTATIQGGKQDFYLLIENEACAGTFLREAFPDKIGSRTIRGNSGKFLFTTCREFDTRELESMQPLFTEQSNSAFISPGKFFFKIFRRLQPGTHPEEETLTYLNRIRYQGVPQFFGSCHYETSDGKSYTLGILKKHLECAESAWEFFVRNPVADAAFTLGNETARMHIALAKMKGCKIPSEAPPFEKLEQLLNHPTPGIMNTDLESIRMVLPRLKDLWKKATEKRSLLFAPQRIHGDYHLGQVLVQKNGGDNRYTIIDFEGEPSRNLDFRRGLRSPAADIAGMIRSFQYAEAVGHKPTDAAQKSFIDGYAQAAGLNSDQLWAETRPYIIAKAVYEACYELEFRPDWFWIPAKALVQLANPGE